MLSAIFRLQLDLKAISLSLLIAIFRLRSTIRRSPGRPYSCLSTRFTPNWRSARGLRSDLKCRRSGADVLQLATGIAFAEPNLQIAARPQGDLLISAERNLQIAARPLSDLPIAMLTSQIPEIDLFGKYGSHYLYNLKT